MVSAVEAMAEAGARWIQVRIKQADDRDRWAVVESCCRRLEGSEADLWVDDRADLAALLPVAGVHVGQADLPPAVVRELFRRLDARRWIGLSCHAPEQVSEADADPDVDVVACGPIFPTVSKVAPDPALGLDGLARCRARTSKPLVAIGGIDAESLPSVLEAGADCAVVLGAVCRTASGEPAEPRQIARGVRQLLAAAGPPAFHPSSIHEPTGSHRRSGEIDS